MKNNTVSVSSTAFSARQCAVQLLSDVLERKRSFDEAIVHHNSFGKLPERDRNFTRLLVLTTLRRLGQIDAVLAQMLEAPLKGKTQDVQHCLRLGVAQLLWLKTPAHAAVNESVDTVAALGHERMKGVVNAVLKRVARDGEGIVALQNEAELNVPEWLYKAWVRRFGQEAAQAIGLARLAEAPLDISVKADAKIWAEKLGGIVLSTGGVRLTRAGRVDNIEGYEQGVWWVQDVAAALPVKLLGNVRGKTVLDLCAAPGGKTAQLASAGAKVIAVDQSARRLKVLEQNMQRLGLEVETVEADILKWKGVGEVDAVLLDAPCSATGTLRRHPELVWHRTADDLLRLVEIQKRLLRRAAKWVKKGGRLVYCVCSLQEEEGEEQVKEFLANHKEFVQLRHPVGGKAAAQNLTQLQDSAQPFHSSQNDIEKIPTEFIDASGAYVTHPGLWADKGGVDGFYAAVLINT